MQTYVNPDIQELPLSSPYFYTQVEQFLATNGLRMEKLDRYLAVRNPEGKILAGAGLSGDIIKCVAVDPEVRSEGLVVPLISRIVSDSSVLGVHNLKVFTKPENQSIFESLGFKSVARAPKAVLMENGGGLERYCDYLRGFRRPYRCGVTVMNANPFTLGHRYLVEKSLEQVEHLFVIPVREDNIFPYGERLEMIKEGLAVFGDRVTVLEGSAYCISQTTFPTYFLKELSDASETQMSLDADLFARHIAPALDASVRFMGTEPDDALTARYNVLMKERFPAVTEIQRLEGISASKVRKSLAHWNFRDASQMTPESTHPYLLARLACDALCMELATPLKPGLVCPFFRGAHKDMDNAVMLKGILAIKPFFPKMARAASVEELRTLGIEAEKAMLEATGGVNTHRGAIFSLGLALNAVGDREKMAALASAICGGVESRGARAIALDGYRPLFEDWLPYFRSVAGAMRADSVFARQATLLRIISTLDDTCVVHRVGQERAEAVKREAAGLLEDFSEDKLRDMCDRYAREGISPGGAADMLALTIFIDSIIL